MIQHGFALIFQPLKTYLSLLSHFSVSLYLSIFPSLPPSLSLSFSLFPFLSPALFHLFFSLSLLLSAENTRQFDNITSPQPQTLRRRITDIFVFLLTVARKKNLPTWLRDK